MIALRPSAADDPVYMKMVESLVNRLVISCAPRELFLLKIDHWFDFKWRNFEGKAVGAVGSWNVEKLKIPPFIPDRVLEQLYFERIEGKYRLANIPALHVYQSSSDNITGRALLSSSGTRLFTWFSGGTKDALRASVMAYIIEEEGHKTFYVSLVKKTNWQIFKTDGVSRNEAAALLETTFAIP